MRLSEGEENPPETPPKWVRKSKGRGGATSGDPLPAVGRPKAAITDAEAGRPHSSGTPALRRPAKKVSSAKACGFAPNALARLKLTTVA